MPIYGKGGSRSLEYFNTFFLPFFCFGYAMNERVFKIRTVTVTKERRNQWILIRYGQCQKQRKRKIFFFSYFWQRHSVPGIGGTR